VKKGMFPFSLSNGELGEPTKSKGIKKPMGENFKAESGKVFLKLHKLQKNIHKN
jgi:hypothetical protein